MSAIRNYLMDEDAISVEQIVFVVAGLAVAIAIGWYVYNTVANKANEGTNISNNANKKKASGSEFNGGAFGN